MKYNTLIEIGCQDLHPLARGIDWQAVPGLLIPRERSDNRLENVAVNVVLMDVLVHEEFDEEPDTKRNWDFISQRHVKYEGPAANDAGWLHRRILKRIDFCLWDTKDAVEKLMENGVFRGTVLAKVNPKYEQAMVRFASMKQKLYPNVKWKIELDPLVPEAFTSLEDGFLDISVFEDEPTGDELGKSEEFESIIKDFAPEFSVPPRYHDIPKWWI